MTLSAFLLCFALGASGPTASISTVSIELELPQLAVRPYFRPYVAAWIETPEREGVRTLFVWREKDDWLKDLRQWWRKLGRSKAADYDGVSGATKRPGIYQIQWDGKDQDGKPVPPGVYLLHFEAAREEGGREFLRQEIVLGGKAQSYHLAGQDEFGGVTIRISGGQP